MGGEPKTLSEFVGAELARPVQPGAKAFTDALAKDFNGAAVAVLYYGSCLRTGKIEGLMPDFYVLVSDYKTAHGHFLSALGNRLVPPNVYYRELPYKGRVIRAKVATLSLADFEKRVTPGGLNVSLWARFAQPSRLVFAKNRAVKKAVIAAVAEAAMTMAGEVLPLVENKNAAQSIWVEGLRRTYGAEFRSEDTTKAEELFKENINYFNALTPLVLNSLKARELSGEKALKRRWVWRKINGKTVSLLRLIKAMFTFQGGIDYLAWKIRRSSGVEVNIKPWHRKVPLLAGVILFIQLRLKGAFR